MYVIGLYCHLVFEAIGSPEMAYDQNSMFILPLEGVPFLRYPLIAVPGLLLYFIIFIAHRPIQIYALEYHLSKQIILLKSTFNITKQYCFTNTKTSFAIYLIIN